jgi:hypothetical protein
MDCVEKKRLLRTPRLYRFAANIYRGIVNREGSLKTLLNQKSHNHPVGPYFVPFLSCFLFF